MGLPVCFGRSAPSPFRWARPTLSPFCWVLGAPSRSFSERRFHIGHAVFAKRQVVGHRGGPGPVPDYAVSPALPPSEDGRRTRNVPIILNVLCLDGFIPAGKYIIDTRAEPAIIDQYRALLRQTGTPESKECIAFRRAHHSDKTFSRLLYSRFLALQLSSRRMTRRRTTRPCQGGVR